MTSQEGTSASRIWGTLDPFIEGGAVMGRTVANASFLQTLLRLNPFDAYHFYIETPSRAQPLREMVQRDFPAFLEEGRIEFRPREALRQGISRTPYHAFHLSDCINSPAYLAAVRNAYSCSLFPITSPTHSLSYERFSRDFLAHLWPGTTARDAVVATSRTAASVVAGYYEMLECGYGLPLGMRPVIHRIPLGVDVDFYHPPSAKEREQARLSLGLEHGEVMLLVFARLSPHSKMDFMPVLRALRRLGAADVDVSKVSVCLAGWNADGGPFAAMMAGMARNLGVGWRFEEGPSDERKRELFWACDVFLSPVDNPQETFGLTLLEAGAMARPVLASAYDGYRDLVVDGETGFLVPTIGPRETRSIDAFAPLVGDAVTHLHLAQQTAVDVPMLAARLQDLITSPELRERMGKVARKRMVAEFSWESVVRRYVTLWDELWSSPVDEGELRSMKHPFHVPYARVFGDYFSQALDEDLLLRWSDTGRAVYREQDFITLYDGLEERITPERVRKLVFFARKPLSVGILMQKYAEAESLTREDAAFGILWVLKQDLLEKADA